MVELTLALHRVFDSPRDKIIWDIGHQAHAHKIITGRRAQFHTIKQEGGLSGFLRRTESPHDIFGAGHANMQTHTPITTTAEIMADLSRASLIVPPVVSRPHFMGPLAFRSRRSAVGENMPILQ